MERVAESVKLLADIKRHEKKFRIVRVMTGLENSGHSQFFRQNDFAQLVDRFLLRFALRVSRASLCRREFVRDFPANKPSTCRPPDLQLSRELDAEHGGLALEIELSLHDELAERNDFLLLLRSIPRISGASRRFWNSTITGPLHIRRGRDDARRVANLHREVAPIRAGRFPS